MKWLVELNDQNELIGVEILPASTFLRDAVLESIQAKTLRLLEAQPAYSDLQMRESWERTRLACGGWRG